MSIGATILKEERIKVSDTSPDAPVRRFIRALMETDPENLEKAIIDGGFKISFQELKLADYYVQYWAKRGNPEMFRKAEKVYHLIKMYLVIEV